MSKYKVGDKVVMKIISADQDEIKTYSVSGVNNDWRWCLPQNLLERYIEPLSTYTEPLEAKIRRQAAEITRLLSENKRLKAENGNGLWNIEQARAEGQNEAWELARKIVLMEKEGGMKDEDYKAIFGGCQPSDYILKTHTYPEAAAKVKAWKKAKEKPQKTMLQDFLEKYPKAILDQDSTPFNICPCDLGYKNKQYCERSCMTCWNRPLEQIGGEE